MLKFIARIEEVNLDPEGNLYIVLSFKGNWAKYYAAILKLLENKLCKLSIKELVRDEGRGTLE